MERFKENLRARHEQNIAGVVMIISFSILAISLLAAFSFDPSITDRGNETAYIHQA